MGLFFCDTIRLICYIKYLLSSQICLFNLYILDIIRYCLLDIPVYDYKVSRLSYLYAAFAFLTETA